MNSKESMIKKEWTKVSAEEWLETGEWRNGFNGMMPYKGTDIVEFAVQYHRQKVRWDKAFAWLAANDVATIPAGRYDIDGDFCFANVQDVVLKQPSEARIESHRKYIDIQWTAVGSERFGIVKPEDATVSVPYTDDFMFWTASKVEYVLSDPHTFFLFFPDTYHQPCLLTGNGCVKVRKVCLKIAYEAGK